MVEGRARRRSLGLFEGSRGGPCCTSRHVVSLCGVLVVIQYMDTFGCLESTFIDGARFGRGKVWREIVGDHGPSDSGRL